MKRTLSHKTTISVISIILGILIGSFFMHYTNAQKSESGEPQSIEEFTGVFDDEADIADNYLRNGDFYSRDKSTRFNIDTSYIDPVATAIFWYDKVITEFPNTDKANQALKAKMQTLLGWTDGYGNDKKYYGLYNNSLAKTKIYFPLIETTYNKLAEDYPEDRHLEAYSYQIAQAYWYNSVVTSSLKYRA